ncbi:MAG: DEAD/DEAH box helicase [Candidatus Binatus sp.]|jgi:ATP-dependent Lhr-like helicase|uniref:DEAD/DEAH box helicase n=1 Tax=Candidatus Binatus sp. TaxID=2811406 RepID=UPI003D0ABCA3
MPTALDNFHPAVRAWFERRFSAPSRAQELGWPVIGVANDAPGFDVLLCAPTGSGKTLAAFMWAINGLVVGAAGDRLRDEVSVLYVSPLKALANDIRLNLEEPLDGVRDAGAESGLDLSRIRAGLRTGDTSASERTAMLRRPPHILVTTPESLFILLTSPRFREKLAAVRHVIVDELHALAGNKRGAHLALTLERLERFVTSRGNARPNRIGLSATLNPIEKLAGFLAGYEVARDNSRSPRPIKIVRADDRVRTMDLQVIAPGPELGPLATHPHWEAMYDEVARLIGEHRTTLVFTLSRRFAERVALNLQKRLGADAVMAHHGSLARAERLLAEQRLKRGELKAIVATASLELGIDVGAVELVCQLDSPKSISAAIQRVGRSGHSLGATPKGRFFALTTDDLLECGAAVRAIRRGHLDEVEIPMGCADIAAQQIVAIAAEEEEISEAELLRVLRSAYNFGDLDAGKLRHLLEQMSGELPERIMGASPKIFFDRVNGRVRPRRSARLSAITSGGTIPEAGNYDVVIESEGRKVGDVEEDFAQESSRGDVFSLGSMPWQIQRISRGRLMVEPAPGMAPSLPFWQTEAGGRSQALSAENCDLRREIWSRLERNESAAEWLTRECAMSERAATQAVDYVRRGVEALGAIPDEKTVVVERFFDGVGGTQIVIHTPFGIRLNRGLGLAIRKRLCQSFDFEIQASAIDDGVLLALNARHSFPLDTLFSMLKARNAREVLIQAILAAPMFEVRFRHVATRALAVMRSSRGKRVPAWIQRLRSQELLSAIFPGQQACFENRPATIELPDHFLIEETIRECLEESTDLPRTVRMLEGIESGAIRTVAVDAIAPSVFAHRILLAWDYSFLDDGERANRRSRTVTMNRGLAEDVFRKEDLSELLAAEAVESVVAEVTGLAAGRRPRSRDELYELIRAHGSLTQAEIEQRAGAGCRAMIAELDAERRIARVNLSSESPERIIASEDKGIFAAAYPTASIDGGAQSGDEGLDGDGARAELVRRAMKTCGPATAGEIAARLHIKESEIERMLAALEGAGGIFRGHFTRADAVQWCDRYNLERIHRMTLARVRAEIEPCADHEYAAFRLRWMRVGGAELPADQSGVAAVLEQLSGIAATAEIWEHAILPARFAGYRPEMLDLVCMSGQMKWVAVAEEAVEGARRASTPSRVTFIARKASLFIPREAPAPADAKEQAVLAALGAAGAQYLDEVAERANISERDALSALWRMAAAGQVSNDNFAPLRMFAEDRGTERVLEPVGRRPTTRHDAAVRARLKSSLAGRWSLVRAGEHHASAEDARELALKLLERHGILAREMLGLESTHISWSEIAPALRRLEYSGAIARGWFVRSISGEQYALPEAVEMLRAARTLIPAREKPVALSAIDPANPYGAVVAGCGIAREAANVVVIRAGRVIAGLQGRALITAGEGAADDESFSAAVAAILALKPRITIDSIDGVAALQSPRVGILAAMRFHSDGRSLVFDGLHGPVPAGASRRSAGPG